jgi:hypothetical protein
MCAHHQQHRARRCPPSVATPSHIMDPSYHSSYQQLSYIQHIILTVQTSTAVCVLVAGNAELNAQRSPLPTPSHIVAHPVAPPVGNTISTLLSRSQQARLLLVGNAELNAQCFLLATLSHIWGWHYHSLVNK